MGECDSLIAGGHVWTRRTVLKTAGLGAFAWALPKELHTAAGRTIPIAVQLYSVRGDCRKDFDSALEQLAKMGFEGVEFAGYYNYDSKAKELRNRLDELKLKAAGTHISTASFREDTIKSTIEFHQTIGCKFLIVPGDGAFTDPERSKSLAETFNKTAEILKPLGMACGFHNHTAEFKKDGDKTYWDLFAERTSKDVILQQDCGWTAAAGFDPVEYVKKYPGRTKTVHFKPTVVTGDKDKKAILGQDSVDWAAVFSACSSVGGTEWIVIEQETYPDNRPAMECTEQSLAGLKKILRIT
ncbi:MAG: sugar phosphate isomerase/epimerase [Acidobacteriia bacterium]|nr:sugar phosphate isomerase/epimerase [Terriglobia bacterium]